MMLDRSDANAQNQAMVFSQAVMEEKRSLLNESRNPDFTYKAKVGEIFDFTHFFNF